MAHEIEMINGQAQMAYVGEVPWHGLGVRLPEDVTPKEMQQAAGLDWSVTKVPMGYKVNGNNFTAPKQALVREDDGKFLSVVGEDWIPVQNDTAFEFFKEFCDAGSMTMHTAGSLKGGKMVWALAKIASDFTLFGGDKVEGYLLFSNPHQFGKCVDVRFTPTRVVCNNTLTMALGEESSNLVRVTHRNEFDTESVKEVLGLSGQIMEEYKATAEILGNREMKDEDFKKFLNKIFGNSTKQDRMKRGAEIVYDLLDKQPGAEYAKGSWWQGINAYTYYTDHLQGRSADARLNNIWFGMARKKKLDAFELALEMSEAA